MSRLTTHVLDIAHGAPATGVIVRLRAARNDVVMAEGVTNSDGRLDRPLLEGATMRAGAYVLDFAVADYFRARGVVLAEPPFLDHVLIAFAIADASAHYHVPLLVSPYGYSTYRGS